MIVKAKCMVCRDVVYVHNCHYQCNNCGFAANWDEGSDNQLDYPNNVIAKKPSKRVSYKEDYDKNKQI